jgi:hypothetical protein
VNLSSTATGPGGAGAGVATRHASWSCCFQSMLVADAVVRTATRGAGAPGRTVAGPSRSSDRPACAFVAKTASKRTGPSRSTTGSR